MSTEYFYGTARTGVTKRSSKPLPPRDPRGKPVTGRIVKILVGHSHGFIRLEDQREVYFHRADLHDGTAFNDLAIGDAVRFELFEDAVSGARALRVVRQKRSR